MTNWKKTPRPHAPHPDKVEQSSDLKSDTMCSSVFVSLDDKEGQKLLQECHYSRLLPYFCKQVHLKYCALCSAAICLNEILESCSHNELYRGRYLELCRVKGMKTTLHEDDILKIGEERSVFRIKDVNNEGLTLQTFASLINVFELQSKYFHVFQPSQDTGVGKFNCPGISSVEEFRSVALENLKKPTGHVVVNYLLAECNFGHFSPLGGYSMEEDRFLLLDVWPRNPIGWVKTEHLFNAMVTEDSSSRLPRGFCVFNADNFKKGS